MLATFPPSTGPDEPVLAPVPDIGVDVLLSSESRKKSSIRLSLYSGQIVR